jgi:hypothetical protein
VRIAGVVGTANLVNITKDTKTDTKLGRNVQKPTAVEKPSFDEVNWSHQKISHWARQPLPGLSYSERVCEVQTVLWEAYEKWDCRQTFDAFVPLCWHRRRYNIIRHWMRKMRQLDLVEFFSETLQETYAAVLIPECPVNDPITRKVWALLALGFEPRSKAPNVLTILGISLRTYYSCVQSLRTEIVRQTLTDGT